MLDLAQLNRGISTKKYSMPIFHQMIWKKLSGMKLGSDRSYGRKILNKSFVSN